jgi:hypothetical protein
MLVMHYRTARPANTVCVRRSTGCGWSDPASYDLLTMVRDAGWVIRDVKTKIAHRRLMRAFRPNASHSAAA